MKDIKKRAQGLEANAEPRDIRSFAERTGNIYESLTVVSKRAKEIGVELKQELHAKLDEFAVTTENLEEIHENKEQIEISKFYERLPNPAIIALNDFIEDKLEYRFKDDRRSRDRY